MANLRDLRRRIRSVKNTQKLTKAMKMVSAAKLRRAQERILAARPYAAKMLEVLNSLAKRVDPSRHPLLARRGDKRVEVAVITAEKGLCGGFNSNIIKEAILFLQDREGVTLNLIGRKGRDFFRRRTYGIRREHVDIFRQLDFSHAARITEDLISAYVKGELDAIYLIYNEFKSVLRQNVVVERLLPVGGLKPMEEDPAEDYIYEPGYRKLFDRLLPKHIETQIYRALLESSAAEQAARMTAMDGATQNAGEMIQKLTLVMNRVRQAAITKEIIEVVSGAEVQ
ncbi:MAG: ATP synthase F1 subunit gamma [Acidobacteriota bacterium]